MTTPLTELAESLMEEEQKNIDDPVMPGVAETNEMIAQDEVPRTIVFTWKPVVKADGETFKFLKFWGNLSTMDIFESLPTFMRNILPEDIEVDEEICHYYVDFTADPRLIFNLEVGDISREEVEEKIEKILGVVHRKKMYYSTEHAELELEDELNEPDKTSPTIFTLYLKLDNLQWV
nr:hypothetical protein K-LCC10_0377 [Kaumoebavirus]